ncbi:MAG: glycosyl transferase family 2 [Crocinitomicaceae bacterium]|nr:glycosyl transferase family 2 [Crocinitomicaceae bacterium]
MLLLNNISLNFGGYDLYKNVTLQIKSKDKIGLTGKNGAGKSTLMKLILGMERPSSGDISITKGFKLGYLPQELDYHSSSTIFNELVNANKEVVSITNRLDEINQQLTTRTDYESDSYLAILDELSELNERLIQLDGDNLNKEAEMLLKGLGFDQNEINLPYNEFSGGWKMRVEIAKLLIQRPDVLLLDEPTNHLDIESIQWLEKYLKSYSGIILLISHDRQFLDNITNRTVEISKSKFYDYNCNYSNYLRQREEELLQQIAAKKNQEKYVQHTQQLINKFRAKKNKASFAQSLIKKLDKLEDIEIDSFESGGMKFTFPEPIPSGKVALTVNKLAKNYPEKEVLKNIDFSISRGDKISLVGKNGTGKSTLIKSIVKDISFNGEVIHGHNINVGYFAQDETTKLDPNKTVFQTIDDVAVGEIRKKIRQILGSFLFSGDDVEKKVKVLSGGEKTRLSLCKLLLEPYNFLILDEPTNHLDIVSKEILKEALERYTGTLMIVSHDRDFLDGLTDKVFYIKNKELKIYYEGLKQFLESYYTETNQIKKQSAKKEDKSSSVNYKKLSNRLKTIERKIESLEAELIQTQQFVNENASNTDLVQEKFTLIKKVKKDIENKYEEWAQVSSLLEK